MQMEDGEWKCNSSVIVEIQWDNVLDIDKKLSLGILMSGWGKWFDVVQKVWEFKLWTTLKKTWNFQGFVLSLLVADLETLNNMGIKTNWVTIISCHYYQSIINLISSWCDLKNCSPWIHYWYFLNLMFGNASLVGSNCN